MAKNLYSPSMLKSFLNCKYTIFNEINEKALKLVRKEKGFSDLKLLERGNVHEEDYFKILKDKHSKVINIKPLKLTQQEKFKKTVESMKEGFDVIRGGYLVDQEWLGEFDFLIKVKNSKSKLGDYSYEVTDTKNSLKIKVDHVIQVSMYSYLLEQVQGTLPDNFHIVLRTLEVETVPIKYVNEFFKYNKKKYELFLKKDVEKVKPEKCNFCKLCDWAENCENIWIKEDNLNQVGGINKNYIKKLKTHGIKTLTQLSKTKETEKVKDIKPQVIKKLVTQAKLQKEYQITGKPVHKVIEENLVPQRGFNLLPEPSECDLFFDLESVPYYVYPKDGLEYLFGIYYVENNKPKFEAFWAHNEKEEKENLIKFFEFTKNHFKKYPKAKIYHYAKYEITALTRLTSKYRVKEKELVHYLNLQKFVDLFKIIKQAIQVSENSYSIKEIEKFYDFKRSGEVKKANVSGDYYSEYIETKEQRLLDEIESYNKQDCHSTYDLRNWLVKIRPEDASWFVPAADEIEDREFEVEMDETFEQLKNFKTDDKNIKQIISDLLGFFRRETKPEWREYFERRYLTNEELVEDLDAIGDLKKTGEPYTEKLSKIYTFTFDEQDYKLKKGTTVSVLNHLGDPEISSSATIVDLDQTKRTIKLKKGIKSGTLDDNISIGPGKPRNITKLEASNYRFIRSYIKKENKFKAIFSILKKEIPNVKGIKLGEKLIKTNNFLEEIPKLLLNLNNSYLYIQGPPGTGKTYQAGNAIIELIKEGKKVGITANSHKVIHNVIDRVEKWADEKEINFRGLKAGRLDDLDTTYSSKHVKSANRDIDFIKALTDGTLLFAGTKYHFSSSFYEEKLDYIFIDEAGQLSLADLIVIGSTAKNIVLIGDQNQLGQPIKGTHPGISGISILDFLLEGQHTIPENKGVFLNKTFRLHPKINEFTSDNFYESRLIFDESTEKRKIDFDKKGLVKNEGITYLPMDHKDNGQKAEEEGEVILKLFNEIIGRNFIDINNKTRKLTIEDILVISPYNAQVNYLHSILDKGARVGTIDKFQGQEAAINIISMATSDADSIPRNKEFLFDRNRLNVAISRAQCASIILFNPVLLDLYPTTYEQIKLLNNFYKILEYKVS
jgi:uncharacterized protein